MTPPFYSCTVASLTRGWSYSATQVPAVGVTKLTPAQIAALPAVALADGLTFDWGFSGAQVPGPMDPTTATVRLAAKTATDMPAVERGDLITIDLRTGAAGARIIKPAPMRVTGAEAELADHPVYGAVMVLQLVERRAELQNATVIQGGFNLNPLAFSMAHWRWRPRLAELAAQAGWSIGCPSWWADAEDVAQPVYSGGPVGNQYFGLEDPPRVNTGQVIGTTPLALWDRSVYKCVDELLMSHLPSFWTHTAYSGYQPGGYPAGWGKVGPVSNWGYFTTTPTDTGPAVADPASDHKVFLMPASRRADGALGRLPLQFAVRGGVLTLAPQHLSQSPAPAQSGHARIALDAAWCDLPATVRKSRDGAVNQVNLSGVEVYQANSGQPQVTRATFRTFANSAVQAADGVVTRNVETQLYHGTAGDDYHPTNQRFYGTEAAANVAPQLLTDDSARQVWVYDQFTVKASRIPDDLAGAVLSRIAPRAPTETDTDSHVLRHLTIYRPASKVRISDGLIGGFIVKGKLEVKGGDITFTLNLTPGSTVWVTQVPASVTVGDVDTGTYQAQPCSTIDPLIRVADLANVGP